MRKLSLLISTGLILSACGNNDKAQSEMQSPNQTVMDTGHVQEFGDVRTMEKSGHSAPTEDSTLDVVPDTSEQTSEMPRHNAPNQQSIDEMKAAKSKKKR